MAPSLRVAAKIRGPQRQVFVAGVEIRGPQRQVIVAAVEIRGPQRQVFVAGVEIRPYFVLALNSGLPQPSDSASSPPHGRRPVRGGPGSGRIFPRNAARQYMSIRPRSANAGLVIGGEDFEPRLETVTIFAAWNLLPVAGFKMHGIRGSVAF